ncbi:pneumococcal-type histidine triad protein [Gemella cuniculi]|uniref:pneumococcal-type histidine triad protein n=1 Tax=Gemella cuniculi TaxID=150240 RepID=UPI0003FC6D18|nr:pneumococcal-type histidine triad protein [Gemella cuniculi]
MNKNKKNLVLGTCGTLAVTLACYGGYQYGKYSTNNNVTPTLQNISQVKKIAYADKINDTVVTEITEDGYVAMHGDHSHFEKGLVPYNAKILDKLVYKDKNYKLKDEDIQYELAQGYVIKINGKFYYYPKEGIEQTNIVDEETAKNISSSSHHHSHSSSEKEDNYKFNPKDIVSETADGYVVRHGDHYHYIKKSDLSAAELAQARANGVNNVLSSSTAGITHPTSDGYIFKGESDIIGRNSFGFIVKHGSHNHIIPFSALRGTKWEYLLSNNSQNNSYQSKPLVNNQNNSHSSDNDGYVFDPKDIVAEDENGYTVRHGDHYHYIPKTKNNNSRQQQNNNNPIPSVPDLKPSIPEKENNNNNSSANKYSGILKFSGVHYKTSDDFILDSNSITSTTSSGLLVTHNGHTHFIFYYQLVNSKFENLIPFQHLAAAKEEYSKLENEVLSKIDYLSKKLNLPKDKFSFVITNDGSAIKYNDTIVLLKNINKETPSENNIDNEIQEKINYLAKLLNIDKKLIKIIETKDGKALVYPHGDHTHTILLSEIHPGDDSNILNEEIQKQIDYIADVYGVPKEAVKVTRDFFIFNEPSHEYDPTHIHPYLIPRNKFKIPEVTGDPEVDFEQELLALSERTGIDPDKIKVEDNKFVIPHGSHNHYVKIKSGGAEAYFKNKIPNIIGPFVNGDFDKQTVFDKIDKLISDNETINKDNKKQINRINRALKQLKASVDELPTNSTKGYLTMLENFDKKYIHIDNTNNNSTDEEFIKKYNELLTKVKNNNIERFGLSKSNLIDELNNASSNHDTNTFTKIEHLFNEISKFDSQAGPTALSYINYFLENIDSDKIDNNLREELAYLIKTIYESEAQISESKVEELVGRLINAKNILHYSLLHGKERKATFGENYNKLNNKDENGKSIRLAAESFVNEVKDFLPNLEFSTAKYPDNFDLTNNNSNTEEDIIQKKIEYLAKSLGIDKNTIQVIDTEKGKALLYPHGDHTHSILLDDIDLNKPIEDPHANSGAETLKKLGFDDDIIHDIQHATADTSFPENETDTEKMKQWLATVKYLNIGQNKDPLKRKGLELMPNIEILGVGFTPIDDITPVYKFKKLKQLYLTKTGIKDYSFLKNIPTLEGIDFSQNDVNDITFLKDYPNLKVVAAAGNNIENIESLKNLSNLESLNLDNNNISDISALKNLSKLKAVSLENNKLTKLDALNGKKDLTRLFLSNNSNLELSTLNVESLEELTVNNSNIRDLSVIKNLPNLKTLVANDNKINTLKHLNDTNKLETLQVNNNLIENLNIENNSLKSLEIKNNKLENLEGIDKISQLENLDASKNNISNLPKAKQNSLINLNLSDNKITSLDGINNFSTLKYLSIANNYISSLKLNEKNKTLEYLDISRNNLSSTELNIPNGKNIPDGISKNFEKVDGGSIKDNYELTQKYLTDEAQKLQDQIEKLKNEKKLNSNVAAKLKQEARVVSLDIEYSVDKSKNKLITANRELNAIKEKLETALKEQENNPSNSDNNVEENNSNKTEDNFEFNVENIISEDENGYVVKHGDHNHYVRKDSLTKEQLEKAKQFLKQKEQENNSNNLTKAEINNKKNYIALFYGLQTNDIKVENNYLVFKYNGTEKKLALNEIVVPNMSNDLEEDFESELETLAKSMGLSADNIQIQDGQMIVNHGDHNHYYPIKSPGWRLYLQNKIPYIEIPKISGEVDEAIVNNKITELENKARSIFQNKPGKLRRTLAWLKHFREFNLPWHLTATEGYFKALETFEKTQLK